MLLDFFVWDTHVEKVRNTKVLTEIMLEAQRLLKFVSLAALANVVCFENFTPFWATY